MVSWALSAPHHTCPHSDKDKRLQRSEPQVLFYQSSELEKWFLLAKKAAENVNSNFILMALVSGLNLTKG